MAHMTLTRTSDLMTVPEFLREARIGRSTAYALIRAGAIPSVRFGKAIRIPRSVLTSQQGKA
jgi:excisionase family DNA binding protein